MSIKSKFKINNFKDYLTTSIGVACAQLIAIFSIPFIAKISGPEVFGEYNYILSLITMFAVISSLKLELTVFTINERIRRYLPFVYHLVTISGSLLLTVALLFFSERINLESAVVPLSIALVIYSLSLNEFFIQNNIRDGQFKINAMFRLLRASLLPIIFYSVYLMDIVTPYSILLSLALSNILPITLLRYYLPSKYHPLVNLNNIKEVFFAAKHTILFMVPAHFLNRYSANVFILTSGFFANEVVGIAMYALVAKILLAPVSIFTSAMSDVVKREIYVSPINGLKNYLKIAIITGCFGVIAMFIVFFFSDDILLLVMGEEWVVASSYAIALLPIFFVTLVFSPLTHTYIILKKQKIDLIWQIFHAVFVSMALYIGLSMSTLAGVWFYSIAASISIFISFCVCIYLIVRVNEQ